MKLNTPDIKENQFLNLLAKRKTSREFSSKELDAQHYANLLWAGIGINREDGRRTAPTARNMQDIELYLIDKTGAYYFDAVGNSLVKKANGDFRKDTGFQEFVGIAPVEIVIVSDHEKMNVDEEKKMTYSNINAGYVSQNLYLYCASVGLGSVARASVEKEKLAEIIGLANSQKIILVQTVGYIK